MGKVYDVVDEAMTVEAVYNGETGGDEGDGGFYEAPEEGKGDED